MPLFGGLFSRARSSAPEDATDIAVAGLDKKVFTYGELETATNGFSRLIGEGAFGQIYWGRLVNGREVAVKVFKENEAHRRSPYETELSTVGHLHHRHIVSLIGWCAAAGKPRLLVYEYVPYGTLQHHLHGEHDLDWATRFKISYCCARVLAFLHEDCEPRIIHRGIKSSNILLDNSFEPKVAGFSVAKFLHHGDDGEMTTVVGTLGYVDPEYMITGRLTEKTDVYSFGVVLLELITGNKPFMHQTSGSLVTTWAKPILAQALVDGNYDALVDSRLGNNYDPTEMKQMVACAAACVRDEARRRPQMSQIVRALEGLLPLDVLQDYEAFAPHEALTGSDISNEVPRDTDQSP